MFGQYFSFTGRITRKTFLQSWLIIILTALVLRTVFVYLGFPFVANLVYMLLFFSQISLIIRRCHDLGLSKMWTLGIVIVAAIPPFSLIPVIYLMWAKGSPFDNEYGEAPRD